MSCVLFEGKQDRTIPMCELPGGKLAVVVEDAPGRIVQKDRNDGFIILGCSSYYNHKASHGYKSSCNTKVRVLEEGELIEVRYSAWQKGSR